MNHDHVEREAAVTVLGFFRTAKQRQNRDCIIFFRPFEEANHPCHSVLNTTVTRLRSSFGFNFACAFLVLPDRTNI